MAEAVLEVEVAELVQDVLGRAEAEAQSLGQGVAAEGAVERTSAGRLDRGDRAVDAGEAVGLVVEQVARGKRQLVEVLDLLALGLVHDLAACGLPGDPGRARDRLASGDAPGEIADRELGLAAHHEVDPPALEDLVGGERDLAPEHPDLRRGRSAHRACQGEVLIEGGARRIEHDHRWILGRDAGAGSLRIQPRRITVHDHHLVPLRLEHAGHVGQLDRRIEQLGVHGHPEAPHQPAADAELGRARRIDEDDLHDDGSVSPRGRCAAALTVDRRAVAERGLWNPL